jgi:antitoxin component YwqK of YwqJK toxin-antitoxin module
LISIKDSLTQLYSELNKTPKNTKNDVSNKNNSSNSERKYYYNEINSAWENGIALFTEKSTGKLITGIICSYENDGRGIKALGTIRFESNCVNGIQNGKWIEYQGEWKEKEGNFKNGKQDGIWKEFHFNGRVRRKTEYRNGTVWEDRCYDTNGDEIKPCPK